MIETPQESSAAEQWRIDRENRQQSSAAEVVPEEPQTEVTPLSLQRLTDLVRYCRHQLHEENLITDEEFAALVNVGSDAARRLEGYDSAAAQIATLTKTVLEAQSVAIQRGNDLIELRAEKMQAVAVFNDALRELVDQIATLQDENENLTSLYNTIDVDWNALDDENEALKLRVAAMEKALRPFTDCKLQGSLERRTCAELDEAGWPGWKPETKDSMRGYRCDGCTARAALGETPGEGE